jgi:hypothetical protein
VFTQHLAVTGGHWKEGPFMSRRHQLRAIVVGWLVTFATLATTVTALADPHGGPWPK